MGASPRDGEWVQTYSGLAIHPLDPRPGEIVPEDIAHHTSMLCRYRGAPRVFYSVAEHQVLLARWVLRTDEPVVDREGVAKAAFLHDGPEAYLADVLRQLKEKMPWFIAAEDCLRKMIYDKFDVPVLCDADELFLATADWRICKDERAALLGPSPRSWGGLEALPPLGVKIEAWAPARAEAEYLDLAARLGIR
jgi:hypothetical protein